MATMMRSRVRSMKKQYSDQGPDLLRPADNARHALMTASGSRALEGWYWRKNPPGSQDWTEWKGGKGGMRRGALLQDVEDFQKKAGDGAKLQIGRKRKGKVEPRSETLLVKVTLLNLANTKDGPTRVASLAKEQFGDANVLGFSCREYNNIPGSGWSDHAWGDAVDIVRGSGNVNDVLFDWCNRMGREGCFGDPQQFIGSRDGRVYASYAPRYVPTLGGPSSHLMHVHCSYVQHYGRDPGCR